MHNLRLYGLLVGLTITTMLICDALAFKVVKIHGYEFACSGLIYSFSFFLASITTEVYGFNLAGRIIWVQLLSHVLFVLATNLFVLLPSPDNSMTYLLYFNLYQNFWRILIGSCFAIPLSYFINDIIISKLKIYMYGKIFIFRFLLASIVGNAILVCIAYPATFYSQYSLSHIFNIAFNTWVYKVLVSFILLPVGMVLIRKIKKFEKLDYYDYGASYNPISVFNNITTGMNNYAKSI